jgi:hypothetical protein
VHLAEVHWLRVSLLQSPPSSQDLLHLQVPSDSNIYYRLMEAPGVANLTGWNRREYNRGTCWTLVGKVQLRAGVRHPPAPGRSYVEKNWERCVQNDDVCH